MRYNTQRLIPCLIFFWISVVIACSSPQDPQGLSDVGISEASMTGRTLTQKQTLGKRLFFDKNLSTPIGQACADCHSPKTGFANPNADYPVSQGVHKDRFGNRNDLPAAYASFSPKFHYDSDEGIYVGGQFWDGRAADLMEQAKGPFLNPLEMANPDAKAVVEKVSESEYADLFRKVFGVAAFDNPNKAYDMVAEAIAAYEQSSELNQFTSKYDLYLAGRVALTERERGGLELFEDEEKGNCAACHPSKPGADGAPPLFTDFTYDNLGIPKNLRILSTICPRRSTPMESILSTWASVSCSIDHPKMASSRYPHCEMWQRHHPIFITAFSKIFAKSSSFTIPGMLDHGHLQNSRRMSIVTNWVTLVLPSRR